MQNPPRVLVCVLALAGSFNLLSQRPYPPLQTTVTPLAGEDVAHPCQYEMAIPPSNAPIRAVFVVFERGQDIGRFYNDQSVWSFAERHRLAMMMPRHCASKHYEDMDIDPAKGLGRALFAALDQFAALARHPELKSAPVVLLGFSGAGAFAARLVEFAPRRVAAAILAHAGQFSPLGLDTIQHSPLSLTVPELILVGGQDKNVGTERPYAYFSKYWGQGAPWLFVTQNDVPHCCVLNAKDLILAWLDCILRKRLESAPGSLALVDRNRGFDAFIRLVPSQTRDTWNLATSNAADAEFQRPIGPPPRGESPAGWLPSKEIASKWREFVAQPSHPIISMP